MSIAKKILIGLLLFHNFGQSADIYVDKKQKRSAEKILLNLKSLEPPVKTLFHRMKIKPDELVQAEKLFIGLFGDVKTLLQPMHKKRSKQKRHKSNEKTNSKREALVRFVRAVDFYLPLRESLYQQFFAAVFNYGYVVNSNAPIPPKVLDEQTFSKHRAQCDKFALLLVGPLDNYIKLVLDYLFIMNDSVHLRVALENSFLDLRYRMVDGPFLAYGTKAKNKKITEQVTSTKTMTEHEWFGFYEQKDGSFFLVFQFAISKDVMIPIPPAGGDDMISPKVYSNFAPAPNGFMFILIDNKMYFSTYRHGDPFSSFSMWKNVELSNFRAFASNNRFHLSALPSLQTTINFIEYDDIDELQNALDEIAEEGMLNDTVVLDAIVWLMSEDSDIPIGATLPSFYPKHLKAVKKHYQQEEEMKISVRASRDIAKSFSSSLPSVRDYSGMLDTILDRKGNSLNNRLFKKCVKLFLKKNENDVEQDVDQKGSHMQVRGKAGKKSTTLVEPHGKKAKRGIPVRQVQKMLTLPEQGYDP